MTDLADFIDTTVPPSGLGCQECDETGSWWFHLRRCALCGHVGCCDDSLNTHATAHYRETGHRLMRSFEPGEDWFWDYVDEVTLPGPRLTPPESHPADQSVPGPAGRLPADWQQQLGQ